MFKDLKRPENEMHQPTNNLKCTKELKKLETNFSSRSFKKEFAKF